LYEQTDSVISRIRHKGAPDNTSGHSTGDIYSLFQMLTNVASNYKINNVAMAPELGWDDFAEEK
jgi:hypothetical protein